MAGRLFIGELIERTLREQGRTVSEFAQALGIKRPNAYRIFQQYSIDTALLFRISCYLHHDFFCDYSADLNSSNSEESVS